LTRSARRCAATVLNMKGADAVDTVTARVLPAPQPPAALAGTWTRVVTAQDAEKAAPQYGGSPPVGRWKLVFDRVGAWELTPTGIGIVNEYDAKPGVLDVYAPIQMTPPVETAGSGKAPGHERRNRSSTQPRRPPRLAVCPHLVSRQPTRDVLAGERPRRQPCSAEPSHQFGVPSGTLAQASGGSLGVPGSVPAPWHEPTVCRRSSDSSQRSP
jgi:hypothetical protein